MRTGKWFTALIMIVFVGGCATKARPVPNSQSIRFEVRRVESEPGLNRVGLLDAETEQTVYVTPTIELTNRDVADAKPTRDQSGRPAIAITLTPHGREVLAKLSREHLHQQIAYLLDGKVVSAPTIMTEMHGGHMIIMGRFTESQAARIAQGILFGR